MLGLDHNYAQLMSKKFSQWNPKYELLFIVIKYNLASIGKMGYKEIDDKQVKPRGAHVDDDEDEHEAAPKEAQEKVNTTALKVPKPATTSLDQILGVLGQMQLRISQLQQNFQGF